MFDFIFPTEPFGGQTLRLVAQAQQGGGDLFDIARTCRDIKPGDKQSWEKGWLELAQRTEARAREALGTGRKITARDYFFHANQYYRMSDVFLTYNENDRKAERFRKAQECFRAGAKLHTPPIEVISVRCGGEEYEGYFCHPENPTAPEVVEQVLAGAEQMVQQQRLAEQGSPVQAQQQQQGSQNGASPDERPAAAAA